LEGQTDVVDGADATSAAGFDDASHVGVELGGPLAAKAVGDLSVDGARAQGPFRAVVGGCQLPMGDEDEMGGDFLESLLQLVSVVMGGRQDQ
jgi:hypothetical protein